jgi:hypothetical protein
LSAIIIKIKKVDYFLRRRVLNCENFVFGIDTSIAWDSTSITSRTNESAFGGLR